MADRTGMVYLLSSMETGGAQMGMVRLLQELNLNDFAVTVVALRTPNPDLIERLPDHVTFVDLNIREKWRIDRCRPLIGLLADTDVLVCSLFHATILGRVLGSLRGVSTVVNWQHNERIGTGLRGLLFEVTNPLADAVLADSEAVAETVSTLHGAPPVHLVPLAGIDMDRFCPSSPTTTDRVAVGTLGTLTYQKQHDQVLAVANRCGDKDIEFHIAGGGPRRDELERRAKQMDLSHVRFHGHVDDAAEFLRMLDIYFQPSRFEGLCITVIEAMACGLPVVASEVGGIAESVVHEGTGYLAEPSDTHAFTNYIRTLADDRHQRHVFGNEGRVRVADRYSRQALVESFERAITASRNADR